MAQALDLASDAVGLASPNPTVGCVIVREGHLVGQGAHEYDRLDHAEVVALRQAGDLARGATAYVTLEPCSHHGRTGPCTDALTAAGVARVVVATADANPAVLGRGIEKLRQAGIEVATGVLQQPAQRLNDAFAKYIRTGLPFVTLKAAMSLDGRIAPPPSDRKPKEIAWITGAESRRQVQQLRHSVDAVITGIGTVLADDPMLTDRSDLPRRRPLLRVVLDSQLRLPTDSKLAQSAREDLIVFTANPSEQRLQALSEAGVEIRRIPPEPGSRYLSLTRVLQALGEMQITSVMVEAGSQLNASFLNAGLVHRLYLFYAAYFLGAEAQPLLSQVPEKRIAIQNVHLHQFGLDFAIEAKLDDPWLL
jgi:diaminohydroxyphosphoribosylaminopyrimidine deaminase / 5-amino-6-(5-phosphoribosylamino)uracil reductase